jgi:hypothetical protein
MLYAMELACWIASSSAADPQAYWRPSISALTGSIGNLPQGARGWIALPEAAHLFSSQQTQYAFGERDNEGRRRLEEFAATCKCEVQFVPTEARMYFRREPHQFV